MTVRVERMKSAFVKALNNVVFKGSAINKIQGIAIEVLNNTEQEFKAQLMNLQETSQQHISKLDQQLEAKELAHSQALEQIKLLENKLSRIIESSNQARKSAAARGNRYKAKYESLLDDIEAILPGAKILLLQKALPKQEKIAQLAKLNGQIDIQKKCVRSKIRYAPDSLRDCYLTGYGKQRRILRALVLRKNKLENKKSY